MPYILLFLLLCGEFLPLDRVFGRIVELFNRNKITQRPARHTTFFY
jgi:hypothetical protein